MTTTWFRLYHDFLKDEKIISLAFEDQRHYIGILILKSEGTLDKNVDETLLDRIVAQNLWIDHAIIRDVKKRLFDIGLINKDWQPKGWNNRQKRSDKDTTNSERQKRFRDKKQEENNSNALCNGEVTGTEERRGEEKREDKPFSFTLKQLTQVDNLSKEYLSELKTYIEASNKTLTYEEFINGLESKGTKYKNFKSAYTTWANNKDKWNKQSNNVDEKPVRLWGC